MSRGDWNSLNIEINGMDVDIDRITELVETLGYDDVSYDENEDCGYSYYFSTSDDMGDYVEVNDVSSFVLDLFTMAFDVDIEVYFSSGNLSSGGFYESYYHEADDDCYYVVEDGDDFISDLKTLYEDDENDEYYVERIELDDVENDDFEKSEDIIDDPMKTYKNSIEEDDLCNLGLSDGLLSFGDEREAIELVFKGMYDKSVVDEEYIVTSFTGKKTLRIDQFSTRQVIRKKIILYYMEWDEWSSEHSRLLINKCLMTYLQEKGITNFFDVIEIGDDDNKKPIDFVDFFNWLAPRIKHNITDDNIVYNSDSKLKFSAPYKDCES